MHRMLCTTRCGFRKHVGNTTANRITDTESRWYTTEASHPYAYPDAQHDDKKDHLYDGDTHEPSLAKSAVHRSADNAETAHDVRDDDDIVDDR